MTILLNGTNPKYMLIRKIFPNPHCIYRLKGFVGKNYQLAKHKDKFIWIEEESIYSLDVEFDSFFEALEWGANVATVLRYENKKEFIKEVYGDKANNRNANRSKHAKG